MTHALVAAPVKIHTHIILGKLDIRPVRVELEPGKLVIYQHSRWLLGLGLLGIWLSRRSQGKRMVDVALSDVAVIGRGKFGLNKKVLEITTVGGDQYRFSIADDKAALIRGHVGAWSQLVEAGEDKWQVLRRTELPPLGPQPTAQA